MDSSFLGSGWNFPPVFTGGGRDVVMATAEEDIRQSLEILLSTRLGERTLLPDFGSDLSLCLFEEAGRALTTKLTDAIGDAILFYEPRVKLEKLEVRTHDLENGVLLISLYYVIKAVNSRFNMVYPFYINEATQR
jgi:hypothetical protein